MKKSLWCLFLVAAFLILPMQLFAESHDKKIDPPEASAPPQAPMTSDEKTLEQILERIKNLEDRVDELSEIVLALQRFPLPEKINFCGEPVPLDQWYVQEKLDKQLLALSKHPRQIATWYKRSGTFFPPIEIRLKKDELPECIKYLVVAESSLLENAHSSAGAAGPWQFIKSTAKRFNLRYSDTIDERKDFEKATDAAIQYLKKLYNEFRDWPLAMAAYNAGEEKVRQVMKRQKRDTYWNLEFRNRQGKLTETNDYVYRILAIQIIFENPRQYGFIFNKKDQFSRPQTITVEYHTKKTKSLEDIAREHNMSLLEFSLLNPHIRRNPLPAGTWSLKIPVK